MWIRERESNEKGEDQTTFSVQKFPQTLVFISKFMRFSTNSKVKTKKKRLQFNNVLKFLSSCDFPRILKWRPKKKFSSPKLHEIRCEFPKKQFLLVNLGAISTNLGVLGLDLHSSSPEPVNCFLGGHKQSFGGTQPRNAPCGAKPALMGPRGWFQRSSSSSFEFLLAEGDSVERSNRNVLQGTFCFQLSTAFQFFCYIPFTEVESSRTHFEVLGLRL